MRAVLRSPAFRLLFVGVVASMVAESILLLALAIWVKELTGSDGMAGATIFAIVAPMLLAPLVGWVVDRFRRRPFFIAVNISTAVLLSPLLAVRDRGDVWIIYLVGVCYGLSYIALSAAVNGLLKEIVPDELLAEANGALQTVKQGLRLIGPLIGAALYAGFGGWTLAVVGACGFLIAAAMVSVMRIRESAPAPAGLSWLSEIGAGIRHLAGEPALRRAVGGTALAMLVIGFSESLAFAYVDQGLGREPTFIGVLLTAQGVGGLLGGLSSPAVVRRLGELATIAVGLLLFALAVLVLIRADLWLGCVAIAVGGYGIPLVIVGLNTLVQRRTPQQLLGRVSAANEAVIAGPQALSIGLGAILISLVDYRMLFALMGAVMLIASGYLWRGRRLAAAAVPVPAGSSTPDEALPVDPPAGMPPADRPGPQTPVAATGTPKG